MIGHEWIGLDTLSFWTCRLLMIAASKFALRLRDGHIKILGELRGSGPLRRRQSTHSNKGSFGKLAKAITDEVAQLAIHAVPNHRVSNTLGHDEADLHGVKVGLWFRRRRLDRDENSVRSATHASKGGGKVRRSPHTVVGRKQGSGGDLLAALATTVGQNGAAGAGAHALAEAVHLGATAIIRLESPLDHGCTPTLDR